MQDGLSISYLLLSPTELFQSCVLNLFLQARRNEKSILLIEQAASRTKQLLIETFAKEIDLIPDIEINYHDDEAPENEAVKAFPI